MEDGIWVRFPVYTQYAPVMKCRHNKFKPCCPSGVSVRVRPGVPNALLAQLEERPNTNRKVGGSNPSRCTKDDTKRRMSDVERRVARVHTKDKQ